MIFSLTIFGIVETSIVAVLITQPSQRSSRTVESGYCISRAESKNGVALGESRNHSQPVSPIPPSRHPCQKGPVLGPTQAKAPEVDTTTGRQTGGYLCHAQRDEKAEAAYHGPIAKGSLRAPCVHGEAEEDWHASWTQSSSW